MNNKKVVAGVAGLAVVGILSYLGYRVIKELNELDMDFFGENIDDLYHYRYPRKNNDQIKILIALFTRMQDKE